ncbi:hypothetical protein [Kocuria rhizophila]|uniref:hypothetical protein n=1 Tax=Kocuria rhizophila TaxID=72000 RepID=UPI001EF56393|nr:hypothetical protein [Kocuria rhizophila]WSY88668.1 hypothetical protein OH783_01420 [Kocuria rhizophila]WSZ54096.1 hypothetical protein OG926_01425 [Kocuria rhizophila]
MSYPQNTPAPAKPYRDRRTSARMLQFSGLALIIVGLVGGLLTYDAPAYMLVLTLAVVGAIVWAVGQIRETLERPHH